MSWPKRTTVRHWSWLVLLISLVAGGCGEGRDGVTLEVSGREWQFSPGLWSVPAGTTIEVEFTNTGNMSHEWTLVNTTVESEADYDPATVLFTTGVIKPGDTVRASFTSPATGTYTVGCFIPSHFDQGMKATLRVSG